MTAVKRKIFLKSILLTTLFTGLLLMVIKEKHMSYKQSVLRFMYPVLMKLTAKGSNGKVFANTDGKIPPQNFYDLAAVLNNGDTLSFSQLKGKKILLVNTASDCGYTAQYADLEKLYQREKGKLIILGFPSNDFKEQEKAGNREIARFCSINYGVSFPLLKKSRVLKGPDQHPVFRWLSDSTLNGWNSQEPVWNFSKYLVSEKGVLLGYYGPAVSPMGTALLQAVDR